MMRYLTLLLALLMPSAAHADRYLAAISIAIATENGSSPAPAPVPSGVCENCGGRGKLGDGTVFVDCPECDGPAKAHPAPAVKPQPAKKAERVLPKATGSYYPTRGTWWNTGRPGQYVRNYRHLMEGEHAGVFDEAYLKGLDYYELNALHSDHHDELRGRGRVKWQYVVRAKSAQVRSSPQKSAAYCPSGNCPNTSSSSTYTRSRFRIFR